MTIEGPVAAMAGVFDAIVVGAGIEGSAIAYELAKDGCKTLLLEQVNISSNMYAIAFCMFK